MIIPDELENDLVELCCLALDYQVCESSDPKGYDFEIKTELNLLRAMGYDDDADKYEDKYIWRMNYEYEEQQE